MQPTNAIVVGIDGSASGMQAMNWAAAEAERRGMPLHLAYAAETFSVPMLTDATVRAARRECVEYGHELMADAVATLVESFPAVQVHATVEVKHAADLLVELSATAGLVVLGRPIDHHLPLRSIGSVAHRVAAHALCTVVMVDARAHEPTQKVVVGVSESPGGMSAMRFACAEAKLRGLPVQAIRTWSGHDTILGADGYLSFEEWCVEQKALLERWLAVARAEFPTVAILDEFTSAPLFTALAAASENAELLVLGCRRDDDAIFTRMGPVTSWLATHSPCTVAIVGHDAVVAEPNELRVSAALSPA